MTPEQENFDALRRVLKLKRYEQPPPGYFNKFSREVIIRIQTGDRANRAQGFDRLFWEASWLQRLIESFQARPAFAAGFGAAVCALAIGVVTYSQSLQPTPMPPMPTVEALANVVPSAAVTPSFGLRDPGDGTLATVSTNSSLNPLMQPAGSLFEVRINPQPAGFSLPGGGN